MVFNIVTIIAVVIAVAALPVIFMRLIYPDLLKKKPVYAFIAAAFFVLIGFLAALFTFSSAFSMAMIAFSSLMILPFIIKITEPTEKEVKDFKKQYIYERGRGISRIKGIFKRNEKLIIFYSFLFFGMALEFMMLFAFLPPSISDNAFASQITVIGPAGNFWQPFADIFANNVQILVISFALSVFFGAGSIFILCYNASIAGVMYGSSLRTMIWQTPAMYDCSLAYYIPHTVIEILAYLLAAIAGGILIRGLFRENIEDAIFIFSIALVLLLIGGIVEVTVPSMLCYGTVPTG